LEETAETEGLEEQAESEGLAAGSQPAGLMAMEGMLELAVAEAMAERVGPATMEFQAPGKTAVPEALAETRAMAEPVAWVVPQEELEQWLEWMPMEAMEAWVASEGLEETVPQESMEPMELKLAKSVEMEQTEEMEPPAEPVELEDWADLLREPGLWERMEREAMEVREATPEQRAMEETERLEMQPHPMAGLAAKEAMWELPDSEAWEEAARPREPTVPTALQ
jgi:hypothetical protein